MGLDDDRFVIEIMLGVLFRFSQFDLQNMSLNFDEFMVGRIHSQLVNFHYERHFRYWTLLLLMVIHANLVELQEKGPLLFFDNFNISEEVGNVSFFEFLNKVMERMYQLIFEQEMPRVFNEMKDKLQSTLEPTGD